MRLTAAVLTAASIALTCSVDAQTPPSYSVTPLSFLAFSANSSGQVVGVQCSDGTNPGYQGYCTFATSSSPLTELALVDIQGTVYQLDQYANLDLCGTAPVNKNTTLEPEPLSISEQGVILLQSQAIPNLGCLLTPTYSNANAYNISFGYKALELNSSGAGNVATGYEALNQNTSGSFNGAYGSFALAANTTGQNNTAFGYEALRANTTGKGNAAQGTSALSSNTTGIRNLAVGNNALINSTTGNYNIGLGFNAGSNVTIGSNNIEIGALGTASDDGVIQIGVQGTQTATTIAGIYGTSVTGGSAVYVTSKGQLGVQASSERYKADIEAMPDISAKLGQLRPVTFHYKADPKSVRQYGLIAEEVDKVYPELVIRDDKGKIQGIHYEELAPMLLSEMQHERKEMTARIATQASEISNLQQQHREMQKQLAELNNLKQELNAALRLLRSKEKLLAQR